MLRRPDEAFEIEARQIAAQTSRRPRKLSEEGNGALGIPTKFLGAGGGYSGKCLSGLLMHCPPDILSY